MSSGGDVKIQFLTGPCKVKPMIKHFYFERLAENPDLKNDMFELPEDKIQNSDEIAFFPAVIGG